MGSLSLTDEQIEILNEDIKENKVIKVIAFAGTGKTTTLVEYAKHHSNKKFLYIAFNKSVQLEAEKRFPGNVLSKTSHSLAWKHNGQKYKNKLVAKLRLNTVKNILNLPNYRDAKIISDILDKFLTSPDNKLCLKHKPWLLKDEELRLKEYFQLAAKLWIKMIDPNDNEVGMLHDGYLKLYQLSKPKLGYDCILLDEAQDTNPVVSDIVLSQSCAKILVGDPHQQIYGFRGACDAMDGIDADKIFYLTYSFRFGEEIAWLANKLLRLFKFEKNSLKGKLKIQSENMDIDMAIISRTNAMVFSKAATYYSQNKIAFLGGIEGYAFDDIVDTYWLYSDQNSKIRNPFFKSFKNYSKLKEFADESDDLEVKNKMRIVEEYREQIPILVEYIKDSAVEIDKADLILTTAHKAKGSQFTTVKISDDFLDLFPDDELINPFTVDPEEFNLLYVTVTRAKRAIEFEDTKWFRFIHHDESEGMESIESFFTNRMSMNEIVTHENVNSSDIDSFNNNEYNGLAIKNASISRYFPTINQNGDILF